MSTRHIAAMSILLMALQGGARQASQALAQESPEGPPAAQEAAHALAPQDYALRAREALDQGNGLLAGQVLMLNYEDNAEVDGLYVAGIAFEQAGRTELALHAWSIFICESADSARIDLLRARFQAARAAQPCPERRAGEVSAHHAPSEDRPSYFNAPVGIEGAQRSDESATLDLQLDFEFETGVRISDSYALTWAPGLWFGHDIRFRFGFFVPLMLGSDNASIGLEARSRMALQSGLSGEFSMGLHRVEHYADTSTSFGAGINLRDALTIGLRRQSFGRTTCDLESDFSANFVDASFTGKTGATITAIEAGLALLVFGLAAGSN